MTQRTWWIRYRPSIHAHEREHFGAVHEIWRTIVNFNFRDGETHTDPFHPFEHPLATWHQYSPSNRENYFGQVSGSAEESRGLKPCWRNPEPA